MQEIARRLKIESKFDMTSVVIYIRFGEIKGRLESNGSGKYRTVCYTAYMTHGSGGGSTIGGKANRLARLGDIVLADLVIMSHVHDSINFPRYKFVPDTKNSKTIKQKIKYVTGGSALDYEGSYAEAMSLMPTALDQPVIILNGKKKEVQVLS